MADVKKYVCALPTNGHQVGDEVFLTDAEVANFNVEGEPERFVLADEQSAAEAAQEGTDAAAATE